MTVPATEKQRKMNANPVEKTAIAVTKPLECKQWGGKILETAVGGITAVLVRRAERT
jgi:hypothetical protein